MERKVRGRSSVIWNVRHPATRCSVLAMLAATILQIFHIGLSVGFSKAGTAGSLAIQHQWILSTHPRLWQQDSFDFKASEGMPLEDDSRPAIQSHPHYRAPIHERTYQARWHAGVFLPRRKSKRGEGIQAKLIAALSRRAALGAYSE